MQSEYDSIILRRDTNSTPWGFRMLGGIDQGKCLYIHKVNSKSIAARCGLRPGDGLVMVGDVPASHLRHDQAKMEIIRAGNELTFTVKRGAVNVPRAEREPRPEQNSIVVEEPSAYKGAAATGIQSRSFRILQKALNYTESGDSPE